ncbi:type II toxin-antitoxin system YafQ family toxin [Levilactobacillus brevis]|nr:type II toxin-antitoxin system YafQ family toxin [Levilactobacillus brevis]
MKIRQTRTFKRELKTLGKQHYPVSLIADCIQAIVTKDNAKKARIHDHALQGQWQGFREFHPARLQKHHGHYDGWIVIYQIDQSILTLTLVTTGSHDVLRIKKKSSF